MQRKALQFAEEKLGEEQCGKFKSSNNWFRRLCKHNMMLKVLYCMVRAMRRYQKMKGTK